jgi:hypothetical protein
MAASRIDMAKGSAQSRLAFKRTLVRALGLDLFGGRVQGEMPAHNKPESFDLLMINL